MRITHIPTGIVVQCQTERSSMPTGDSAMKILLSKLVERKLMEQQQKLQELPGEHGEIAWGSQIRSYVSCPYADDEESPHRRRSRQRAGGDGRRDRRFIEAYLRSQKGASQVAK